MRKRAHHCELQLSNYHVCNFQFKTYFGSCVLGGLLSECQATRFLQRLFFFIPLCIHFRFVSDVALHWIKCLTTIKLTKEWLTSPTEAFHVEKSPKKGTKVFAEGIFLCVLWRIIFWPRQRRKVQKRICLQSFKAVPLSYLEFFPKESHSTMMDRLSSSPKSFVSRPPQNHLLLLWIYGMPTQFDDDSAARSAKSWPPVTFAWVILAWPRLFYAWDAISFTTMAAGPVSIHFVCGETRRPAGDCFATPVLVGRDATAAIVVNEMRETAVVAACTIGMSTSILAGNLCFLRQKLVTSFLVISFYAILLSSLLSA